MTKPTEDELDYKRNLSRTFRAVKRLPNAQAFQDMMNVMHSRAYYAAERHYIEAMEIVLQPKQRQAVIDKAKQIREEWDGMSEVATTGTIGEKSSRI